MQALRYLPSTAGAALAVSLVVGLASVPTSVPSAAELYEPAPPEPGTEIPSATVNFGMRPYADNTFYVIAMKQGWFEDVGIKIGPEELGLKVTDTNVIALLLNGQLDMSSQYCPLLLPTYKSSDKLKCVAFTDNFLGTAILARPELGLKSFKDYIAEGKDFDEAIKAALAPLEGETLVGSPVLSKRPFEEAVQQFSGVSWNLETMDDAKALVLAKAGRIDFADPEGAPDRLHAAAGRVDRPGRYRRSLRVRAGRHRFAGGEAGRNRRHRRQHRLLEPEPEHGAALPVCGLAHDRRGAERSLTL